MQFPNLAEIDQIRKSGYRPQVVGCFLKDKKILFVYKKEHDLWQLPQGGIENSEDIKTAFFREMAEELGSKFINKCDKNILLFYEDLLIFPALRRNSRNLKNNSGEDIPMKGKKYFFICAKTGTKTLNILSSEFDNFKWASYEEILVICEKIYQQGKKRITINALNQLKNLDLL